MSGMEFGDRTEGGTIRDERARQALREVGDTAVSRPAAWAMVGWFLATIVVVPAIDVVRGELASPWGVLAGAVRVAGEADGFFATNRELQRGIDAFEDEVREGSWVRERLVPPVQAWTLRWLRLANERVHPGRGGWLHFRADVDHVVGPGFLDPRVLEARRAGGEAWEAPPSPDPLPAILGLRDQLAERGISLLAMPTPVKPAIQPETLSGRYRPGGPPLRNPSFDEWVKRLEAAGVPVFDSAPLLAGRAAVEPQYLATDTHWTPEAVDAVAKELAGHLEAAYGAVLGPADPLAFYRRPATAESRGDIAEMLRLPAGAGPPAQSVELQTVLDGRGDPWRPDPAARVLLLGDSFTNIYSDDDLRWGTGAGLAEQLAFHLGRPVDRVAVNAGGPRATREALARRLAAGDDRLAAKTVVVWQFATRELSHGDWARVALPRREPPG